MFGVETKRLNEQAGEFERFDRVCFSSRRRRRRLCVATATSHEGRRARTLPSAFTEHGGGSQCANSERPPHNQLIIDVFIDVRRRVAAGQSMTATLIPVLAIPAETGMARLSSTWEGSGRRQAALERVLDTVVDISGGRSGRRLRN
jgi:hypothetical protein